MKYTLRDNKVYNEKGKVAVAVSSGWGAGWSTWTDVDPTDGEINLLILEQEDDKLKEVLKERELYDGGVESIHIYWLEPNTKYSITEYDGNETLETEDSLKWRVA